MCRLRIRGRRRYARLGVAAVALWLVMSVVGGCSPPDAMPAVPSRYEVLTFEQDYAISPAAARASLSAVAPHTRTTIWLREDSSRSLLSVESRTVDSVSGTPLQFSLWHHGDPQVALLLVAGCRWQSFPPPTKPTRSAVIADAVGPLKDPTASGFQAVGGGVYQQTEGPSLIVLRPGTSLAGRTLTMLDVKTRKTQSVIHDISLSTGHGPPQAVTNPECVSTPPAPPGPRATLAN